MPAKWQNAFTPLRRFGTGFNLWAGSGLLSSPSSALCSSSSRFSSVISAMSTKLPRADYSRRHHRECLSQLKLLCISSRGPGSWCSRCLHFWTYWPRGDISRGEGKVPYTTSIELPKLWTCTCGTYPTCLTPAHIPQLQQLPRTPGLALSCSKQDMAS